MGTHDGRTIRYPHPDINVYDSIKLNLVTNEVDGVLKFDNGAAVFVSGGNNIGRVGVLQHIEAHAGSYDIAHGKDSQITLPKKNGIMQTLIEARDERMGRQVVADEESSAAEEAEEDQ